MPLLERDYEVGPLLNAYDFLGGSVALSVGFEVSKSKPDQCYSLLSLALPMD